MHGPIKLINHLIITCNIRVKGHITITRSPRVTHTRKILNLQNRSINDGKINGNAADTSVNTTPGEF